MRLVGVEAASDGGQGGGGDSSIHGCVQIQPGDIVALDCSHPCTAFDKIPFVPVIDDDNNVIDGNITFF